MLNIIRQAKLVFSVFLLLKFLSTDVAAVNIFSVPSRLVKGIAKNVKKLVRKVRGTNNVKHVIFSSDSSAGLYGPAAAFDECLRWGGGRK